MAGIYDTMLKNAAQQAVDQLGEGLDTSITYKVFNDQTYNIDTGEQVSVTTSYENLKVPIEFIESETEPDGREKREAKIYITPDKIGGHQPTIRDTVTFEYAGSNVVSQISDIITYKGGQTYLFILTVRL